MKYRFISMIEECANEIVEKWHYDGVYSFYDMTADEEDLKIFIDRKNWGNTTFAVLDESGILIGWSSFYMEDGALWLSLGLKPELTGLGLGMEFVSECIEFARSHYKLDREPIRLDVAVFNERAIKVYKKVGFRELGKVSKNTNGGIFEFLRMTIDSESIMPVN
jgi:ribosomal-protein-alanine N-acetyltransferase